MNDVEPSLVRHVRDQAVESWPDPNRGSATWRTLFSHDVTGTHALTSGVSDLASGGQLAPHRHATVETYYILEGEGILTLGDAQHAVGADTSILIPSMLVHGLRNTGPSTLRFLYVFATDAFTEVEYDFAVGGEPLPSPPDQAAAARR